MLTDVVGEPPEQPELPAEIETLVAELQTHLAASAFALTEQLLHSALAEVEATVSEQVTARLREQLPELIDAVLRQHLGRDPED
jgi:cell fate (sporulation/competence/biofilm development) regulator YlbF (YheA/YmcA/DUF963 family)